MLLSGQRAGQRGDASAADPVARVDSGVVRVEAVGCRNALLGTGFLLDRHHVATAAHVVGGARTINLKQGSGTVARGTVVGADPSRDVALVRTDAPIHDPAWTVGQLSLEDLVLAYMGQAATDRTHRPALEALR